MAESRQFGAGRVFGDKLPGNSPGTTKHCAECEAMLADAVDGTLTESEQAAFDRHTVECVSCGQILADARRGAAWLEMLRNPAPEPPAHLLERILAQTSVAPMQGFEIGAIPSGQAHAAAGYPIHGAAHLNVIPFPRRALTAVRRTALGQVMLQPRLAMTAAMAFFSIALTMNIAGIHPASLRASDLAPDSLWQDVVSADTHVVRYYKNLRVVYELESRVHDLESAQDTAPDTPASNPAGVQPATEPATQPEQQKAAPQPAGKRAAPGAGSSRREEPNQPQRFVVSQSRGPADATYKPARIERRLV